MSQTVVTARIDTDTAAKLDILVGRLGRSRSWLTARALKNFVDQEGEFLAFVQEGIDSLDRGEVVEHAEMERIFDELIAGLPNA
jgi:predicted transcriptional regulator